MTDSRALASSIDAVADPQGRARDLLEFASLLRHPKSPDRPLEIAPFWRDILTRIYGPDDGEGRRLVRTAFIFLPRGARKSTIAGLIALAHTVGPFRSPDAQVIAAAADREQAALCFGEATGLLASVPELQERASVKAWDWQLKHLKSGATFRALPADGDAALGKSPSVVIADELCAAWRGRKAIDLWGALSTGAAKVSDSLTIIITTAGDGRDQALGKDLYSYAKKVQSGEVIDPTFAPFIYEAQSDLTWDDEKTWHIANPGLKYGYPDIVGLRSLARTAKQVPALRRSFEQFHLNRWGEGMPDPWISLDVFDEGAGPIDRAALAGKPAVIAVDLSKSFDLTALAVVIREGDGYTVLTRAWLPEETLKRRALVTDVKWREWAAAGLVETIPGSIVRDEVIEGAILELCEEFAVSEVAFDPKFAARLMTSLQEKGIPVVTHAQGAMHATAGVIEMQRAILDRKFKHDGNPVFRWCLQNVVVHTGPSGLVRLDKARSSDSIDLVVAAAMAVGRASQAAPPRRSYLDADDFDPALMVF